MATALEQSPDAAVIRAALAACLATLEALGDDADPKTRVRTLAIASSLAGSLAKVHQEAKTVDALRAVLARQVERLEEVAGQVGALRDVVNGLIEQGDDEREILHTRLDALEGNRNQLRRELGDFADAMQEWNGLDAEQYPNHAPLVEALETLKGNQ